MQDNKFKYSFGLYAYTSINNIISYIVVMFVQSYAINKIVYLVVCKYI